MYVESFIGNYMYRNIRRKKIQVTIYICKKRNSNYVQRPKR